MKLTKRWLTNYFIPIAILIVFLFAPRPPGIHQGYFPLFLVFGFLFWQKEKIRDFKSWLRLFCFAILNNFYYNFERIALITVKKTILALAVCLIIAFIFNFKLKPAYAYVHYGVGGRAWYPTRSFTGNYYGSGGLWGSYHGGNLYGPGNYGGYWWKSPTGRWWYGR